MNLITHLYSLPFRAKLKSMILPRRWGHAPVETGYVGNTSISSGRRTLDHIEFYGGLDASVSHLLDIGCGNGRIAIALKRRGFKGTYSGFDIVQLGIDWAKNEFDGDRMFGFNHLDVYNSIYNPHGTIQAGDARFPYNSNVFDFVVANSVFSHMLPGGVAQYLNEIARVTVPGFRSYITAFLLTEESLRNHDAGRSRWKFPHIEDGYRTHRKLLGKEGAVAYELSFLRNMIEGAGMKIKGVHQGCWSWCRIANSDEEEILQDVLVLTK